MINGIFSQGISTFRHVHTLQQWHNSNYAVFRAIHCQDRLSCMDG